MNGIEILFMNANNQIVLGNQIINNVKLISLVEPDHGTNFIANDLEYLITRLKAGCVTGQIELGGKNFPSLKNRSVA